MNAFNQKLGQKIMTDIKGVTADRSFLAHFQIPASVAIAASPAGVRAAVASTGSNQEITAGITSPGFPRNITATAGGTATDIKAIQVTITGTNYNNETITETLPAFTVDTAGTVQGSKAFKTVTKILLPAHDGTGAITSIGFGEKLGLPYKLAHNTFVKAFLDNVAEATTPTVTVSATAIENNTIDLNTALNGKAVDVYLMV